MTYSNCSPKGETPYLGALIRRTGRSAGDMAARIVSCALLVLSVWGCGEAASWYPVGTVEIVDLHEGGDGYGAWCVVTYRVGNIGKSRINRTTFTITLRTNASTYYRTVVDETSVPPGMSVVNHHRIDFHDPTEVVEAESAAVGNSFYD